MMAALPPEIVVGIANAGQGARTIISMSGTCQSWLAAISAEHAQLWRAACCARFPRAAAIAAAEACTLPWNEIYHLQLRSEKRSLSKTAAVKPSDFVVSFEVEHDGGQTMSNSFKLCDDHVLGGDLGGDRLWTPESWTKETAPKWVKDGWADEYAHWRPRLSLWVSRGMKTLQLYDNADCTDGDKTTSYFETCHFCGRHSIQVDLEEETGQLTFYFDSSDPAGESVGSFLNAVSLELAAV